ncbi:MAG TPA: septum site-determining protein MinD, partial [Thermodesulfobacteriota bacterium]
MANDTDAAAVKGPETANGNGHGVSPSRPGEKKVFVVTSGKGGVGKTTTTANLGMALAVRGRKVCVIDADIGLRNLDVIMGLENRIVFTLVDVTQGKCHYRKALIKDRRAQTLHLLPASQTDEKDAVSPAQMKALLDDMREEFDYILIDCPAGIEQGFRNSIAGADEALVVTTPEVAAIRDADRVIGLLQA